MMITFITCLVAAVGSCQAGNYISVDYYMDPSQSDAFGGVCEEFIQDDSLLINSHVNPFNIVNYGKNKDCWMVLDAGPTPGAEYHMKVKRFDLQESDDTGSCRDYLSLYDSNAIRTSSRVGTLCGSSVTNISGHASQRYLTLVFHSDDSDQFEGFRILATRTEPSPCSASQFHCLAEDKCITERVHCDGTTHCMDGSDEIGCTGVQKFVGMFLRLGLGGIVAVSVGIISGIIVIAAITCCVKCCKKDNKTKELRININRIETNDEHGQTPNSSRKPYNGEMPGQYTQTTEKKPVGNDAAGLGGGLINVPY